MKNGIGGLGSWKVQRDTKISNYKVTNTTCRVPEGRGF